MKAIQFNFIEPFDEQNKKPNGNMNWVNYGIKNEDSHYRIHVAYKVQHVYLYPTPSGRKEVEKAEKVGIAKVRASQLGFEGDTGEGFLIPWSQIDRCVEILIPLEIHRRYPIHEYMLTTNKGLMATQIACELLENGWLPLPVVIDPTDDKAIQVAGTDILVNSNLKLQVKCDYKGGNVNFKGSGFLFLQTAELNPYKRW